MVSLRGLSSALSRVVPGALTAVLAVGSLHAGVLLLTSMSPPVPSWALDSPGLRQNGAVRRWGDSYAMPYGAIQLVNLEGTAAEIGLAHGKLLRPEMVVIERALWGTFEDLVPWAPARLLILDIGRLRFRNIELGMSHPRRAELASVAFALAPDPFTDIMPTYQRQVFLNALYDISLSFEHSPLIGCTSLVVPSKGGLAEEHVLLGRNFDFETHEVLDRFKAVIIFRERGKVPVASVAWAGLSGVVTGINARGVAAVVHGARAGKPDPDGEPVLLTLREALSEVSTAAEAATWISSAPAMISHMVLVTDASGDTVVLERAPNEPTHVRRSGPVVALTNHYEGPLARDPANLRVRESTSTLPRRARLDELLGRLPRPAMPRDVLAILRDRKGTGDEPLSEGDRRAIDASIATHGVVMDVTARRLWVSEGPHLSGRYVHLDLDPLFYDSEPPGPPQEALALP